IAIHEAAGDLFHLLMGQASAAELAASRGEVARAVSHLAEGADLAREMPSSEPALELVLAAAHVAYVDGRAHDAAVLFRARLGLSPVFPEQFRPTIEALEGQGLRDVLVAGANLDADEAVARVVKLLGPRPSAPA